MRPIAVGVDVARPANDVFAFVADVENNPRWQRGMRSCRWTSPPPVGVGSTYDQTARFLGKDVVSSFRVVEHLPGRRIRLVSTAGPFPIVETRSVQPLGDGLAHVSAIVEGDAGGFFRIAGPVLRALVARSVRGDYARLKRLLESGG
ncbi:MAG: hypothetical protein QOD86_1184 [Miltoncostaeaceae bacterium]|jgi:hypothetical protein|nr:hypothetical protein [Miltoncostaeaceae bacterium]